MKGAEDTIEKLTAWLGAIGAPTSLAQAEIPQESINALADNPVAFAKMMGMEQATELVEHLGYYGHIISVQGRVERSPQPAFTRFINDK